MYAIVNDRGSQVKVRQGDTVRLAKLDAEDSRTRLRKRIETERRERSRGYSGGLARLARRVGTVGLDMKHYHQITQGMETCIGYAKNLSALDRRKREKKRKLDVLRRTKAGLDF